MTLRIEIVGEGPRAQRMLAQIRALKAFEISSVSSAHDAVPARVPPEQGAACLRSEGRRDNFAILQENSATGEVEGLPVVTLRARKEDRQGVIWE